MPDGMEFKRAGPPRPTQPAPNAESPVEERERWSTAFVAWYFSLTGGEWPEPPEGGPPGRRWREEYPECVDDPQRFERFAEAEIETHSPQGVADVKGE